MTETTLRRLADMPVPPPSEEAKMTAIGAAVAAFAQAGTGAPRASAGPAPRTGSSRSRRLMLGAIAASVAALLVAGAVTMLREAPPQTASSRPATKPAESSEYTKALVSAYEWYEAAATAGKPALAIYREASKPDDAGLQGARRITVLFGAVDAATKEVAQRVLARDDAGGIVVVYDAPDKSTHAVLDRLRELGFTGDALIVYGVADNLAVIFQATNKATDLIEAKKWYDEALKSLGKRRPDADERKLDEEQKRLEDELERKQKPGPKSDPSGVDAAWAAVKDSTRVEALEAFVAEYGPRNPFFRALAMVRILKVTGADARNAQGNMYFARGEYDRAIAEYGKAIARYARYALAYANRGVAHHLKGNCDSAIADYSEAIRLDPKDGAIFSWRALCFEAKGDRAMSDKDSDVARARARQLGLEFFSPPHVRD